MAGKKQLPPVRIATFEDIPTPPKSLSRAFADDDDLEQLRAKRRILISHIESDTVLARDLAPLMRIDAEITSKIDEILERRAAEREAQSGGKNNVTDGKFRPEAI